MNHTLGRRAFVTSIVGAGAALALPFPSPAATLFVPLYANVYYWDDHYFAWLPEHPIYETFELMTIRRGPVGQLVWAFFTERAGSKRQVHYYNDPAVAREAAANYTPMQIDGPIYEDNRARSISVGFTDVRSDRIVFDVRFPQPVASMDHAGLTDQSGHNRDRFVLFFYRDRAIGSREASLDIAGQPVRRFWQALKAAYSQVIRKSRPAPRGTVSACDGAARRV